MLLHVPNVLSSKCKSNLFAKLWQKTTNGYLAKKTAGGQAQLIKDNLQINTSSELYQELSTFVQQHIQSSLLVQSFALPKDILPSNVQSL